MALFKSHLNTKVMNQPLSEALNKLMSLYQSRKHPLDYHNLYQLVVMVVLSAQDSDKHINQLAPSFFETYPTFETLSLAQPEDLHSYLNSVRNFGNKCIWLTKIAAIEKALENLPLDLPSLVQLPGIGRKSANVILREAGRPAEGIIVDLHVLRVAPRIGIAEGSQPEKVEQQLMRLISKERWGEIGMAISFLGREVCRPTNPKCEVCVMNAVCCFYNGTHPDNRIFSDPSLFD
ncbi:endonuclease III domain-containing protein [Parabacteroides sp. FAFU027]|uniref:endonuclease III domain-containing protein n=1 Tax=Parabacteroides sp. FAFU027 TaxID=2922715 RepID=UPI001FAE98EE|nr:endonuclease III [Parabacteroides sp. FAFU027]